MVTESRLLFLLEGNQKEVFSEVWERKDMQRERYIEAHLARWKDTSASTLGLS